MFSYNILKRFSHHFAQLYMESYFSTLEEMRVCTLLNVTFLLSVFDSSIVIVDWLLT